MEYFVIEGKNPISGEIEPQGNKNEALPIICASILNEHPVTIKNLPMIEDIKQLLKILEFLGASVSISSEAKPTQIEIDTSHAHYSELPENIVKLLRGSVTLIAPMIGRFGKAVIPRPGGDKIGRRRIDTHLLALEALGAKIEVTENEYRLEAKELIGASILLDECSVTATENTIMAAAIAKGDTIIENAASEPHVQGLCRFLQAQRVEIQGIGSNVLKIKGIESFKNLSPAKHTISPDYLEIGGFISMTALTNGELLIKNVCLNDLRMIEFVYKKLGIEIEHRDSDTSTDIWVGKNQSLKIRSDLHGEIPKIDDAPWPAFPADLISNILVTATQCEGTILIHEKLFESRLFFTDTLISMGGKLVLCDPHRVVVIGPSELKGARIASPDIRAGMALVIAALCAEGKSEIQNIIQIDRGYERADERLRQLGANIKREKN